MLPPPGVVPVHVQRHGRGVDEGGTDSAAVGPIASRVTVFVSAFDTRPTWSRVNAVMVFGPFPADNVKEVGAIGTQAGESVAGAAVPSTIA